MRTRQGRQGLFLQRRRLLGLRAESLTDPETYAGTCSRASIWEAAGYSAGYSRHRAAFDIPNGRPKRLWLRPLVRAIKTPAQRPQPRGWISAGELAAGIPLNSRRDRADLR